VLAGARTGMLATVGPDGAPWASLVAYVTLADGTPVLRVSTLAEHGRHLAGDPRASLAVAAAGGAPGDDPLSRGRVTLAGSVERPGDEVQRAAAEAAYAAAVPGAGAYAGFADFTTWLLRVVRVRWVGGFGRMGSADGGALAAAEPDAVAPVAAGAIAHLNADHADALLAMVRALGGHPAATAARCVGADRYGLDLEARTPAGPVAVRVAYAETLDTAAGLRAATVELTHRARAAGPGPR